MYTINEIIKFKIDAINAIFLYNWLFSIFFSILSLRLGSRIYIIPLLISQLVVPGVNAVSVFQEKKRIVEIKKTPIIGTPNKIYKIFIYF